MASVFIGTVIALMGGIASVQVSVTSPEPVRSVFLQIEGPRPQDVTIEAPENWITGSHYQDGTLRVAAFSADGAGLTELLLRLYYRADRPATLRVVEQDIRGLDNQRLEASVENGAIRVYRPGDMNCDGQVNIVDALYLLRWLAGSKEILGCGSTEAQ